jgi:hypothetical protein
MSGMGENVAGMANMKVALAIEAAGLGKDGRLPLDSQDEIVNLFGIFTSRYDLNII